MSYVTIQEVRNIIGVSDVTVIPDATITQAIEFASDELDRLTFTTYLPALDNGTATAGSATTLTDSTKTWEIDYYIGYSVYIYAGTGKGQIREILDNAATSLTVATWDTNPDTTSKYLITYLSKITEKYDGTATNTLMIRNYPLIQVDELKINDTSISLDRLTIYNNTGRLVLNSDAEVNLFTAPTTKDNYNLIDITYHYGVLPEYKRNDLIFPSYIKRMVGIIAGLQAIAYQMGGTYNALSTFTVPNLSGSIGQQYINIGATADRLLNELDKLKLEAIGRYPYMV